MKYLRETEEQARVNEARSVTNVFGGLYIINSIGSDLNFLG